MRSSRVPDVVLAATLHDPRGALADEIHRLLPRLRALYAHVIVATSPPTQPRIRAQLARAGAYGGTPPANLRGPLYRLALRAALGAGVSHVHYLDLDRALHWMRRAPRELAAVLRLATRWPVVLVGRTPAAHRSHQRPLHATEVVVNRLLGARLGSSERLDFLAPSVLLAADRTRALLAASRARDVAIYGEWAALVPALAPTLAYLECRGLDWETPDRDRRVVRRIGLTAYRRRFEGPAEWDHRSRLAREIVRGFERALRRSGAPAPRVHRLPPRVG